jgi:hypothetical protein
LTHPVHGGRINTMATPQNTSAPWYRKPSDRPTTPRTFRIYKEHLSIIEEKSIEASALVRILLDKYFKGELPEVEVAYAKGEGRT